MLNVLKQHLAFSINLVEGKYEIHQGRAGIKETELDRGSINEGCNKVKICIKHKSSS